MSRVQTTADKVTKLNLILFELYGTAK